MLVDMDDENANLQEAQRLREHVFHLAEISKKELIKSKYAFENDKVICMDEEVFSDILDIYENKVEKARQQEREILIEKIRTIAKGSCKETACEFNGLADYLEKEASK